VANPKNEEVLSFKVQADVQTAIKRMSSFERDMRKHLQKVTKASEKMAKTGVEAAEDIEDANQSLLASVKDLDTAYEAEARLIKKLADLQEKKVGATEDETAALDEQIKSLAALAEGMKDVKDEFKDKGSSKKMAEDLAAAVKKSRELKKGIKDSFKQGFSSFLSKDAKGLTENFGEVLKKGIKLGALGAFAKGGKMQQQGSAVKAAGKAQGGLAGFNKSAGGAATESIGKLLAGLSKMAPLLTAVAGILVKVVTMFIDAQHQAKAFNKEILQGASTIEVFNSASKHAATANSDLEDSLHGIRDAAYDAGFNLDWGIEAETHQQVLSTLTQEGVSIDMIGRNAKTAGKSIGEFEQDIVKVSVAYSRLLGVSITEVSQLQAEMVRDLGMGIEETRLAFATMSKEAEESGMAANKFFAILRGVSADLSLFNLRIAEAAKFLKQVGKTMSARSAQEFLNTIKNYYKGMDLQGRIKATLLAGQGATKGILQKDVSRKQKGLVGDVRAKVGKEQADKLEVAMKKGPKETARWMADNDDKLEAGMKESILDAQRMQAKVSRGGIVDLASALKDLDPMGVVEHTDAISQKMFGKPMEKLTDIEMLAFTQMTGMTDAQLDANAKFKAGLDVTRQTIAARIEKGNKLTKDDQELIANLGLTGTNAEKAEKLRQIDTKKMYENMSKEDREKMEAKAKTMEDYARDQGKLTQSLIDKLGVLVEFMTNQFYNIIVDIWDAMPFGDRDKKDNAKAMKVAYQSGNQELIKALDITKGGTREKQTTQLLETETGKKAINVLSDSTAEGFHELAGEVQAQAVQQLTGEGLPEGVLQTDDMTELFEKMTGKDADDLKKQLAQGKSLATAFGEMGIDQAKYQQFLQESLKNLSPQQLTAALAKVKPPPPPPVREGRSVDEAGNPLPVPTAVEKPVEGPSAQAAAADKAAAPGVSAPTAAPATEAAPAAAAPGAGAGAAATPPGVVVPPPPKAVTDFQDAMLDWQGTLGSKNDDIITVLTHKGIKLNKTKFETEIAPILESTVLDAIRVALVEYKLYKDTDIKDFAEQMKDADFDPKTFGKKLVEGAKGPEGKLPDWIMNAPAEGGGKDGKPPPPPGPGHQAGGHIIGRNPDGTAKILRPPAGEMPAFVGAGETVVPKGGRGGGGGGVSVTVNGIGGQDLARMVEVAATDAILKYKRREGLH